MHPLLMDRIVAEVKRLLEEDDSEITVAETLPPPHPATGEDSDPDFESDEAAADQERPGCGRSGYQKNATVAPADEDG